MLFQAWHAELSYDIKTLVRRGRQRGRKSEGVRRRKREQTGKGKSEIFCEAMKIDSGRSRAACLDWASCGAHSNPLSLRIRATEVFGSLQLSL